MGRSWLYNSVILAISGSFLFSANSKARSQVDQREELFLNIVSGAESQQRNHSIYIANNSSEISSGNNASKALAEPISKNSPDLSQIPAASLATPNIIDLGARSSQMGIDPKKYNKFWEKWRLVNVRYRSSPAEQRFVYANDIAWETLKKGGTNFADGAMFGKVAFNVGFDHRFPSSYQATSFSRIQFMKKDRSRYRATDGWGYALYLNVADGKTKFGDPEAQACHACHKLAADHDFVFDTPVFMDSGRFLVTGPSFAKNFKIVDTSQILPAVLSAVQSRENIQITKVLQYKIYAFQGTISEAMLPVARLSLEVNTPVILSATVGSGFVYARKIQGSHLTCQQAAKVLVQDLEIIVGQPVTSVPRELTYCDGVFK